MFAVGVVADRVIARTISYVGFFAVDDVFALDNLIAGGVIAHGISSVCIFAVKNDLFAVGIFAIDDLFAVNVLAVSIFTVDVLFAADFFASDNIFAVDLFETFLQLMTSSLDR
jgi:hypothetical protein